MRTIFAVVTIAVLLCGLPATGPVHAQALPPDLVLETSDGTTRVWVEIPTAGGDLRRVLLRETAARVEPGQSGAGPDGATTFATWSENGQRWFSYGRGGGRSWSEARPIPTGLRLRDGSVPPGASMPPAPAGLDLPTDGRVFLVQFHTPSLPEWRTALQEAGLEVLQFFPHNAHLVRFAPDRRGQVAAFDFVERVEPYHPWYRLHPELRDWLAQGGPAGRLRVRVMAFEWGEVGKRRIVEAALASGAEVAQWWPSGHVVELNVTRGQLESIAAHDDVLWIDPWTPSSDDMDLVREDAGTNFVENDLGFCGQGVRGEVLDSGIEDTHMDFDGVLLHGSHDVSSHGTSTFGIVFGNGDRDGDGNAQGTGHLPCAEQGIFADYGSLGDRFAHTQELTQAPYFASFQSNSWGAAQTTLYTSVSHEMDDIIWRLDFAILNSQSNTGNRNSRPQAWAKNIIAVGGIKHKNTLTTADDDWTGGASIGPAEDGRIKPDINYWYDSIYTTTTGNTYTTGFGGTSAATPEAAGVLGLMLQMWSENVWNTYPTGGTVFERQPHFSTLKALMINNARQYDFSGTGHDLTRVHQGWGRPNAQLALERAGTSFIIDEEVPLRFDETVVYDVEVFAGEPELKITMTYPDPPGTTSSTLHRINDVNLEVVSPSQIVYHGNVGLDAGTSSTPGGSPNGVDTVENVFVVDPEPGTWKVEIHAAELNQDAHLDTPEDDVAFAMVVTGGTGSICDQPTASFTASPQPARVGQEILFDGAATGGAGGPYAYSWDFDNDGQEDSTLEDASHVYHRPYAGGTRLRALDSAQCPDFVQQTIDVTGPDLRFDAVVDLTVVEGNANGALDPGEIWEFRVRLRNDGNEDAVGVSATLVPASNPGSISVLQPVSAYPDIAVGGTASSGEPYRIQIGPDFACGEDAVFSLAGITTVDPANVYPEEIAAIRLLVGGAGAPVAFHSDGFESNTGWSTTGSGEWQFAAPQGLGGQQSIPSQQSRPDPTAAFEGQQVLGNDLTGTGQRQGKYEPGVSSTITSPPIDASDAVEVELQFARWLNVDLGDSATVEISPDGSSWTELFDSGAEFYESAWSTVSYDISAIADRSPALRIRFGIVADPLLEQSGWNIDALELRGVTRQSCEPFARGEPGAIAGLRVDRGAAGELDLSWLLDCGGGTSYGVYRGDLLTGYDSLAPEPGMCAVAGTSASIPEGAGAADFFLVVPNDGASEGGYGAGSAGPRAPAAAACHPTVAVNECAP